MFPTTIRVVSTFPALARGTTREVMFTHDRSSKYQLCTTLAKLARHSQQTVRSFVQCCFTYTETIRTVRDGEPRTSTSTFTQLLSSDSPFKFTVASRPQKPFGLLGTGSPGRPPRTFTQLLSSRAYQYQTCVVQHQPFLFSTL